MRELLRDVAPLLGVILTAIAALFAYRSAERERAKASPEVRGAGVIAVGGALADRESTRLYVEELQRVVSALDRVAAQHAKSNEAWEEARAMNRRLMEHAEEIAGSLREIARTMRVRQ